MKGLELSREYWLSCGKPALERDFPDLLPYLAVGLCGSGSECSGWDDELSRDHDWGPGFAIFLPDESVIDRRSAFLLERAYAKLPSEFMGYHRPALAPVGGARTGVIRADEFYAQRIGTGYEMTVDRWLSVPQQSLLECVNGEIFMDNYGLVTRLREELRFYPEDVRKKKLAGELLLMAQSGQYNYTRCLGHGETGAAQLSAQEFVKSAASAIFLLNRRYMPYYKWTFRALRELDILSESAELFEYLITSDNSPEQSEEKYKVIESVASDIIDVLRDQGLTQAICGDLEKHAYSVNDGVSDPVLRNMHVLAAV